MRAPAQAIDEEVSKIVEAQYQRAKRILTENKDKLTALATQLLEKEVIFKEDLAVIFGERPFAERVPAPENGKSKIEKPAPEVTTEVFPETMPDVAAEDKSHS